MKKIILLLLFLLIANVYGQQAYYNDVNLTLSGIPLKDALATKIIATHTNLLSYSEAREALKIIDLNPGQTTNVLLLYGFSNGLCPNDSSTDSDHKRRNKDSFGGGQSCEWNREHTYPKALGDPDLGTSGPGSDAHHLRAADVGRNGNRDSKLFAAGSGNSGTVGSNWYPGDEWKGDVARMMMYMYLRYGSQCYPNNVGIGSAVANDSNMIDLFLQWNAEDPVSQIEINRNNYLELTPNQGNQYGQGNRNPFIDNPYLATRIWGGTEAEDIWGIYLDVQEFNLSKYVKLFPKYVKDKIHISVTNGVEINSALFFTLTGKKVKEIQANFNQIDLSDFSSGLYFVKIITQKGIITKKIIKQ